MFMLRHYRPDGEGRSTTVNYFSARASAGEGAGHAEVGAASVRTVVSARGGADEGAQALRDDAHAAEIAGFGGVTLDPQAEAAIAAATEACAGAGGGDRARGQRRRRRAVRRSGRGVRAHRRGWRPLSRRAIPPPAGEPATFALGEPDWRHAGGDDPRVAIDAAVAAVKRPRRRSNWNRRATGGAGGSGADPPADPAR